MVFSSLIFLFLFLPACVLLYFARPSISYKNWVLVAFSLFFYAWGEPLYVLLLLFSTFINYLIGRLIGGPDNPRGKLWMILSVIFNLSLLGYFKYIGFLVENLNLLGLHLSAPQVSLPIGIMSTCVRDSFSDIPFLQERPRLYMCRPHLQ